MRVLEAVRVGLGLVDVLDLHAELRPTTLLVTHNPGLAGRCMRTVRLG